MEKETLEEAAEDWYNKEGLMKPSKVEIRAWVKGAKWQQEQMYSEEDMKSFGEFCADYDYRCFGKHTQEEMLKIWFEQFKKK
jgi:hypothetical protein